MSSLITYRKIPEEYLEFTDTWNLHPFLPSGQEDHSLRQSIQRVGILIPPIVREKSPCNFDIITGRRRIQAAAAQGTDHELYCRVINHYIQPSRILQLLLEDHLCERPLSSIEQAYFFQLCLQYMDAPEVIETFFECLGLKKNSHTITRALKLLSLELSLQKSLHTGQISEAMAYDLISLTPDDRLAVHTLFHYLQIGAGKQKRVLALLRDIARRNNQDIAIILKNEDTQKILQHQEMNLPQKAQNLLNHLQRLHTPALHREQTAFSQWQAALHLPEICQVEHSQSFEKDEVTLSITVPSRSKLEELWQQIKTVLSSR